MIQYGQAFTSKDRKTKKTYASHSDWLVRVLDEREFSPHGYKTAAVEGKATVIIYLVGKQVRLFLDEFRTKKEFRTHIRRLISVLI